MINLGNNADTIIALLEQNYRQCLKIYFDITYTKGNEETTDTIILTDADLVEGSFVWDRYCVSGSKIELGSAIAAEIGFSIVNKGYFTNVSGEKVAIENITFEGSELTVQIGIKKWDAHRWNNTDILWFNVGKFIIDQQPKKMSTIDISALDRMVLFDRFIDWAIFADTSYSLHNLLRLICQTCGVEYYEEDFLKLPNAHTEDGLSLLMFKMTTVKDKVSDNNITYRQLVQWIAQLTGTCAYMDTYGKVVFKWYSAPTGHTITITPSKRYSSNTEKAISVTGVVVKRDDATVVVGNDSYAFSLEGNELIQGDRWSYDFYPYLENIYNYTIKSNDDTTMSYIPYECSTVPMPYVEPLDKILYVTVDGTELETIVTNITFHLNGSTNISAQGKTEQEEGYASVGLTQRENILINKLKEEFEQSLNTRAQELLHLNDIMRFAMGLHKIEHITDDGSMIYYYTTVDVETLGEISQKIQDNDVVYMFNSEGVAWCKGAAAWNNGSPTWAYGITSEGNAILSQIQATGINVSRLNSVFNSSIRPDEFEMRNNGTMVFRLSGTESQINKLLVKSNIDDPDEDNDAYIRIGEVLLVPHEDGADVVYVEGE